LIIRLPRDPMAKAEKVKKVKVITVKAQIQIIQIISVAEIFVSLAIVLSQVRFDLRIMGTCLPVNPTDI
jgi:hypothetical protein